MSDFFDGLIAAYCHRKAAVLLWRRQKLLCMEANARYRIRLRASGRQDEAPPF